VVIRPCSGGGAAPAGIKHYRKRLDNGEDQDIDFGDGRTGSQ